MGNDYPPKLEKGMEYRKWKREVNIWKIGTSVQVSKMAAVTILSIFEPKARDFATRLEAEKLKAANGMEYLITELDAFFKEDNTQCIFLAIENLETFIRPQSMHMLEYITEFGRRHDRIKELLADDKDVYHDGILSYRLISQANLSKDQKVLIKAAMGTQALSRSVVEESLKRCFGDVVVSGQVSSASGSRYGNDCMKIKTEPLEAFFSQKEHYYDNERYDHEDSEEYGKENFPEQTFYQSNHGKWNNNGNSGNWKNQFNKRGRYPSGDNADPRVKYSRNSYEPQAKKPSGGPPSYRGGYGKGFSGSAKRCHICDSTKHFAKECQHKNEKTVMFQSACEDVFNVDNDYRDTVSLVSETFNKALIDTGATNNVCGDVWLNTFLETVPDNLKDKCIAIHKSMAFRFGDGRSVQSVKCMRLPMQLCNQNVLLDVFVVPGELPFLFSRQCMKDLGVTLDIENDKIIMDGVTQDLHVTASGHYVAELRKTQDIMLAVSCEPQKKAVKLHRYFGHAKSNRLLELVKNSDHYSKELQDELVKLDDNCQHCLVYKRDPARPKVSIYNAKDVNEVVGIDLKWLTTGHVMIHAIDLFSRFSATRIIQNKQKETIISALFDCWISVLGRPKKFLSDNGGEFINEKFVEMCEQLGISIQTTGADSPFSNGICERHNGLIADSFNKLHDEFPDVDPNILLAWATNAKNSLANSHGYSPYMLIFGRNPTIPGLDNLENLTTLNETTVSKILADQLNCMFQSRSAFMRAINSEKVKRALRSQVPNVEENYFTGDRVYFKKKNQKKWCGPATVIGKDGKQVFLRQGGSIIRVHVTKVILKERADNEIVSCSEGFKSISLDNEGQKSAARKQGSEDICLEGSDSDGSSSRFQPGSDDDLTSFDTPGMLNTDNCIENPIQDIVCDVQESDENDEDDQIGCVNSVILDQDQELNDDDDYATWTDVQVKNNGTLDLCKDEEIRYKSQEHTGDEWQRATIIGRGWKESASKKSNQNIWNFIEEPEGTCSHLKLTGEGISIQKKRSVPVVDSVLYIEGDECKITSVFAVNVPKERYNEERVQKAMKVELDVWEKYGVYKEVNDTGQSTVSTRWVVTDLGKDKFKARLVVRGFEESNHTSCDSPTGDKCSLRSFICISHGNGWKIEGMDIKAAFLQSRQLDREVFVKPPRSLKKVGIIWQLEKPAYGLNDSSRNWYNSISEFLISIGCIKCKYDPALFYYSINSKLNGLVLLHVDDFLLSGSVHFKNVVVKNILKKYDISKHTLAGTFQYIGINITQDADFVTLDQFDYGKNIKPVILEPGRNLQKDSDLTANEKTQYLSLLGKLSWMSYITRPDLKWDVYNASRKNKNPTIQDLMSLNKVVGKLVQDKCIRYPRTNLKGNIKIVVYSDASFGNLDDKINSARGYLIFLHSDDKAGILTWNTNKITRVVASTLESETLGLLDALNHALWIRGIIIELLFGRGSDEKLLNIIAMTDSNQLYSALHSTKHVSNHRLRRDIANIKEQLETGEVSEVRWISNNEMLADALTKQGADSRKLDFVLQTGELSGI